MRPDRNTGSGVAHSGAWACLVLGVVAVSARIDEGRRLTPHSAVPVSCVSCRSSVVEHSLGKGEVESSIPSGSTIA